MRFSWSTHLLMVLALETLTSIIRLGLPILVELIDLVNSVIFFLFQATLFRWLTFQFGSQTVILTDLLIWICFFLPTLVFVLQWLSLHWEILIMLLSQFPLTSHQIHNRMPLLVLTGTIFVIIWEKFHRRVSLNSVLLLLLVDFLSRFRLDWCIYPSHKISGQASLIFMVFSCLCCCHSL